jgi:hypothetical protein
MPAQVRRPPMGREKRGRPRKWYSASGYAVVSSRAGVHPGVVSGQGVATFAKLRLSRVDGPRPGVPGPIGGTVQPRARL